MRGSYITSPGGAYVITGSGTDIDLLAEHEGLDYDALPDRIAAEKVDRLWRDDPSVSADSFNAGDWLKDYLYYTREKVTVLDVESILATPIRYEYRTYWHQHGIETVPPHD
ncbi:hypothetical protein [Bifidobacterium felsineum]|uniref:hypothetical protein n=1 Tax=Bifidobacterium felsineum TaxID=2045440 RepID=UPI001BDDC4ED|nr:hypothetical protein [Bifidobacterium felsineum]MBT1164657.1 hypothetical protein [Bifidobacterium felsineum]